MKIYAILLSAFLGLSIQSKAQDKGPPESGVYFMPYISYENQGSADFDEGTGGFSRSSVGGEVGFKRYLPRESFARIYAIYAEHDFDFETGGEMATPFSNPFNQILEEEIGGILLYRRDNGWGSYSRLGFISMRDPDAHRISSTEVRAMGVVGYRFSDNVELGLGVLAKSQISQAPSIYPVPIINYTISDRLKIVSSDQFNLRYSVIPGITTVIFSTTVNRWRMRLDDTGENPRGIAEYTRFPLSLSLDQIVHKNAKVTLTGTMLPYHKLAIENKHGDVLDESELDPAFQFGATLSFRF